MSSILKYTGEQFNDLLDWFSQDYKSNIYLEKIPYKVWKSMREKNCSWDKWLVKKEDIIVGAKHSKNNNNEAFLDSLKQFRKNLE